MLMHRVTFPTPARVTLDAAGVLTDGAGGGGDTQNTSAPTLSSSSSLLHSSKWKEGEGGGRGLRCCHEAFYHR